MSMNILVETRIAPKVTFEKENPTLMAGEISLNEEGYQEGATGVKIGDGISSWSDLPYIETSNDIVNKWLTIARGTTNSKLVTLPDMNFAYSVVNVDSNAEVEQVVDTIVRNKNYFEIIEKGVTPSAENGILTLKASGVQDVLFATDVTNGYPIISRLKFVRNGDTEAREYSLFDEGARSRITTLGTQVDNVVEQVEELENTINNPTSGINAIVNKLVPFSASTDGLVKKPTSNQASGNYFLKANNTWQEIKLYANTITMSSTNNQTIAEAIEEGGGSQLTIGTLSNDDSEKSYIVSVRDANDSILRYNSEIFIQKGVLFGSAWNDYAEARVTTSQIAPGRVVIENGDDTLSLSTERLQLGGNIVSDTYGMLIGKADKAKTPIALCGRVLAYPNEDKNDYYAGAPVCTGPNGTVSIMTKEEVLHYPECIIGYVSAIPDYDYWNEVEVNGRIWIKVV